MSTDYTHWIFDVDGTLTLASHDFPALKRELGLPPDGGVLEGIAELEPSARGAAEARVAAWEREHAERATLAPDVRPLLDELVERGARLGVLTRNLRELALLTLERCGLSSYFDAVDVLGREESLPKPDPDGVLRLLARWGARAQDAVMVGDHLHDLAAGRAAGAHVVYVDRRGTAEFSEHADRSVRGLDELCVR